MPDQVQRKTRSTGRGGGGIGRRRKATQSENVTTSMADGTTITYSADAIAGTEVGVLFMMIGGSNTGALQPGNYTVGGKGGSGIVMIRLKNR